MRSLGNKAVSLLRDDIRREAHHGDRIVKSFVNKDTNLVALLVRVSKASPMHLALMEDGGELSYGDLLGRSLNLAWRLRDSGVEPGDRVALLIPNSSRFLIGFYAIILAGGVAVPLNIREQEPEVRYALRDCAASAVIYDVAIASLLPTDADAPTLRARLNINDDDAPSDRPFTYLEPASDSAAAIVYTSGTTGRAKGAVLSHFALVSAAFLYRETFELGGSDRILSSVPLTHVTGLTACMLAALAAAATLIVMTDFKAPAFLERAASARMTMTIMVPAMYKLCLISGLLDKVDLTSWRVGAFGGSAMTPALIGELATALPGLKLFNVYGATETAAGVAIMLPEEIATREDFLGRETVLSEIVVMDDEGREQEDGVSGELWIRSPTNATGYWNNHDATSREFIGGFWRSGDIGVKAKDGYIKLVDRKKGIINRGGYKIPSLEIENVINSIPGVIESAVFGVPCTVLGERVHALVVIEDISFSSSDILHFLQTQISDYKVPEIILVTQIKLPRNANGKIVKSHVEAIARSLA